VDPRAEQQALALVISEGRIFGASKAQSLLSAMALQREDFSSAPSRAVFDVLTETLSRHLAPIHSVLAPKLSAVKGCEAEDFSGFIDSREVLSEPQGAALARVVKNLAARRRAAESARHIMALAQSGEMDEYELADEMQREAKRIPGLGSGWAHHERTMDKSDARVRSVQDGRMHPTVASGFHKLDGITGGFQPTLGVICGMPGRAKSAFVASCLRNISRRGESAAIFSMEDRAEWLTFRWAAHESGIPNFVLKYRPLTEGQWVDYAEASQEVRKWKPIWIDDRAGLRPKEVLFAAREAFAELNARAVFLDNMTAMRMPRGDRRDLEFQDFLSDARALAEEFNRPFVVVSHTKLRDGGKVDDMPRLIDCSETTAFDKLARLAYGVTKEEDEIHIQVLKQNNGAAGQRLSFKFNPTSALLQDEEAAQQEIPGL
jgi:replicative DNA helicase